MTVLADTDDDVQAVVAEVETLSVTLASVSDQSKSVVLEVLLEKWLAAILSVSPKTLVVWDGVHDSQEASREASRHAL